MWAINALLKKAHLSGPGPSPDTDTEDYADQHTNTNHDPNPTRSSASAPSSDSGSGSGSEAILAARLAAAREAWQRQQFQAQAQAAVPAQVQAQAQAQAQGGAGLGSLPGSLVARAQVTFSLLTGSDGQDIQVKDNHAELVIHQVADYDYSLSVLSGAGGVLLSCPVSDPGRVSVSFWRSSHSVVWSLCVLCDELSVVQAFHARYHNPQQEQHTNHVLQQAILQHAHQNSQDKFVQARDTDWLFSAFDDDEPMEEVEDEPEEESDSKASSRKGKGKGKGKGSSGLDWDWEAPRQVINTRRTLANKGPPRGPNDESESDSGSDSDSDSEREHKHGSRRITSSHDPAPTPSRQYKQTAAATPARGGNSQLAVGCVLSRTFVGRGSTLGVFSHDDEGGLTYLNRIPTVAARDGQALTPTQLLLQQQDHHMALLDHNTNNNKVYDLDLHRGEIVQEYGVSDDFMIRSIALPNKYAGLETDTTVAAVNNNTLFSLDPRINIQNKMAHKFQYASGPGLTCLATSADGYIAVGSEKGEIRLFSQIGQKAKTLLPGLGDPILFLDVSGDGCWVLATCRRYLLVIPTKLESGKTGFTAPMGNQHKPAPIKLTLSPQDLLRYNITDVCFSSARFNTGPDMSCERWIVSSTGRYIVTWNFESVKRHIKHDYTIKQAQQQVVADQFIYGRDDTLVVTEQDTVYTQHRTNTGINKH